MLSFCQKKKRKKLGDALKFSQVIVSSNSSQYINDFIAGHSYYMIY